MAGRRAAILISQPVESSQTPVITDVHDAHVGFHLDILIDLQMETYCYYSGERSVVVDVYGLFPEECPKSEGETHRRSIMTSTEKPTFEAKKRRYFTLRVKRNIPLVYM